MKRSQLKRTQGLKPSAKKLKQGRGFAASPAQRERVKHRPCVRCGRDEEWDGVVIHPMHLADRSLGGCDEADCVVAGCAECHRAFDEGKLDLLPHLEPHYRHEVAHAVLHLGLARAYERITNTRLSEREAA